MNPFTTFYGLTKTGWKRIDLLSCKRGDIIRPEGFAFHSRFIVQKKLNATTVRCKQITKGIHK